MHRDAQDMGTPRFGTCLGMGTQWAQGHKGHPGHRDTRGHRGYPGHRHIHDHAGMQGDTLSAGTQGTQQAQGYKGHSGRRVWQVGTLGDTHIWTQRAQPGAGPAGMCRDTRVPVLGWGAHRVSSGSDSGSRVLGFCSIHRNSIKERSAPTEGAPAPRGGHGGAATARGPRRGGHGGGLRRAPHGAPQCSAPRSIPGWTLRDSGVSPSSGMGERDQPWGTQRGPPGRDVRLWGTPMSCGHWGGVGVSVQEGVERARAPRAGQGHEGCERTQGGSGVQGVCDSSRAGPEGTAG